MPGSSTLKPENLHPSENNSVTNADFDLASASEDQSSLHNLQHYAYAPPELAHSKGCNYSLDLRTLDLLIYNLLQGEMPYT
jgi:hypothetical protein